MHSLNTTALLGNKEAKNEKEKKYMEMKSEKESAKSEGIPSSYSGVLKEVGSSVKSLVQSEVDLIKAEIKYTSKNLGRYSARAAMCGALLGISVFPFLAFLVVGLGILFGDRYWLSSLIVSVICALVGGVLTFQTYRRIKEEDFSLPQSRESLGVERDSIVEKSKEVKEIIQRKAS